MRKLFLLTILAIFHFGTGRADTRLPQNPDTLRILAIGNSFSDDGMQWLPELLEGAGIHNVILGRLYIGGCSLERHCKEFEGNKNNYQYYKSTDNHWVMIDRNASMLKGLKDEKWDIISLQQVSGLSGIYSSYSPWLGKLMDIVRKNATNPDFVFVWHQTWAYAKNSPHGDFPKYDKDQMKMYRAINQSIRHLQKDYSDFAAIIPSGTAIQLLRSTKVNYANDLTRDGYHLDLQFGRYTAACAWFEALIKPTLGISVKGNKALLKGTGSKITGKEARICRSAAIKAVKEWSSE